MGRECGEEKGTSKPLPMNADNLPTCALRSGKTRAHGTGVKGGWLETCKHDGFPW